MRNWHKKLINVPSSANGAGVIMGIVDNNLLEFIRNSSNISSEIGPSDYKVAHPSFLNNEGSNETRVFFRKDHETEYKSTEKINILEVPQLIRTHITGAAGIMVGKNKKNSNNEYDDIEGIATNATLINSLRVVDSFVLTNTNIFARKNIESPFYFPLVRKIIANNQFIPNESMDPANNYSKKSAGIINFSISWNVEHVGSSTNFINFNQEECKFLLNELFAYGRDGRGSLIIASAGNGENINGVMIGKELTKESSFIRSSNKTCMVAASTIDTAGFATNPQQYDNFSGITEVKSQYSNYGNLIDICAPSTPVGMPDSSSLGIYTPTKMYCGEMGFEEQYITVNVIQKVSPLKLRLQNTLGIFPGQAIELGNKDSFGNEIRYIADVDRLSNTITLNKELFFTKSIPISSIKILIFKKKAKRDPAVPNKFTVQDNTLIALAKDQQIYIYGADQNSGIYTKISGIASMNIEVETNLSNFTMNEPLTIIPGQMKLKLECTGGSRYKILDSPEYLRGFFIGQQIRVVEKDFVCDLTEFDITNKKVKLSLLEMATGNVINIESLSYGHYKSKFGGTSAAAPVVSGVAALALAANPTLNAVELKNILKQTTDKITGAANYSLVNDISKYNYGYTTSKNFGTGRVNASKAVQLASTWNDIATEKPIMRFFDTQNGSPAPVGTVPDSPDIWIAESNSPDNLVPSGNNLYNTLLTTKDQKIYVRVRNTGQKYSFQETDLRVLVAFTSEQNPVFKFPDCWHQNTESTTMKTILIDVKEIAPIAPNSERVLTVKLKKPSKLWEDFKPDSSMKMYILAHIAPFDGPTAEVSLDDIKNNKNLTCRAIKYTNTSINVKGSTAKVNILNDQNKYELMVDSQTTNKKFSFDNINIASDLLDTMQFKFSLINRASNTVEQSVTFKKTNGNWAMDAVPANNWLTASIDITNSALYATHKNAILNYEFNYNNNDKEIEFNVINA